MWPRVARLLRAAVGDDPAGAAWPRLTGDGRQVMHLAFAEARELGHPYMAGERVLLGLLRHGQSPAVLGLCERRLLQGASFHASDNRRMPTNTASGAVATAGRGRAEVPPGSGGPIWGARTVDPNAEAAAQNDRVGAAQMEIINQLQAAQIDGDVRIASFER